MPDDHLRELERLAAAGTLEDEAVYLRERVRQGHLKAERLQLAAYLGHEAARLALSETAPASYPDLESWTNAVALSKWFRALATYDREACARAAVAAGRAAIRLWETPRPQDLELLRVRELDASYALVDDHRAWARRMSAVLDAVDAWIEAPSRARKQTVVELAPWSRHDPGANQGVYLLSVMEAAFESWSWLVEGAWGRAKKSESLLNLAHAFHGGGEPTQREARRAHDVVRDALLPWALSESAAAPKAPPRKKKRSKRAAAKEGLTALAQRWSESGADEDEAAYLRERVRANDLSAKRLKLAAHLGHRPARLALTQPGQGVEPAPTLDLDERSTWFRALASYHREACARAALAAGRAAVVLWKGEEPDKQFLRLRARSDVAPFDDPRAWAERLDRVLDAVAAWINEPSDARRSEVLELAPWSRGDRQGPLHAAYSLGVPGAAFSAWEWLVEGSWGKARLRAEDAFHFLGQALCGRETPSSRASAQAEAALRDALIPWALGSPAQ